MNNLVEEISSIRDLHIIRSDIHWDKIGALSYIESPVRIHGYLNQESYVGAYTYIQSDCQIDGASIGRFCSIAQGVVMSPGEHPTDWLSSHPFVTDPNDVAAGLSLYDPSYKDWLGPKTWCFGGGERTIVGNDVWIGQRAIIRQGVRIGDGAIIASGAVVVKDVEPYAIVGGVPAKIIRYRFEKNVRAALGQLAWWNYDLSSLTTMIDYSDIEQSIFYIDRAINSGDVFLLNPLRWQITREGATRLPTDIADSY